VRNIADCAEPQALTVRGELTDAAVAALVERVEAFSPHFQVTEVGATDALARVDAVRRCTTRDPNSGQTFNFVAARYNGETIWLLEYASSWRH
jgi:hypothetical protein